MICETLLSFQTKSLEPPWGNCSYFDNKTSLYYPKDSPYTQNKCKQAQFAEAYIKVCGCKKPYMPGKAKLLQNSADLAKIENV